MKISNIFLIFIILKTVSINAIVESIGTVSWNNNQLRDHLLEFSELYKKRPIKDNSGGMNSAHMFYCWFITKQLNPKFIIESGIWKGQSTWLFEQAAPHAQIISIDPNLKIRKYISKKVKYYSKDFNTIDWSKIDKKRTLCFFDDHQGSQRINECLKLDFKHILYEDNYPIPGGNYKKECLAPKAVFAENTANASALRNIIKIYYEVPPVFPNLTNHRYNYLKWKGTTPDPLLLEIKHPSLQVYEDEAYSYTWLAYIELK